MYFFSGKRTYLENVFPHELDLWPVRGDFEYLIPLKIHLEEWDEGAANELVLNVESRVRIDCNKEATVTIGSLDTRFKSEREA